MSKYNRHARELDRIAKDIFKRYREAEGQLRTAQIGADEANKHATENAENAARAAIKKAVLIEATENLRIAKSDFERGRKEIKAIRAQLAAEISEDYAAKPEQIDLATIELMKAGVMGSSEYRRIFDAARADGNSTMARIIAKYAATEAEKAVKKNGELDEEASGFRQIVFDGNHENGGEILEAFDAFTSVYDRTERNPALIDHWDELTSAAVENF